MLKFIAIDLQLYNIFKITRVSSFGTQNSFVVVAAVRGSRRISATTTFDTSEHCVITYRTLLHFWSRQLFQSTLSTFNVRRLLIMRPSPIGGRITRCTQSACLFRVHRQLENGKPYNRSGFSRHDYIGGRATAVSGCQSWGQGQGVMLLHGQGVWGTTLSHSGVQDTVQVGGLGKLMHFVTTENSMHSTFSCERTNFISH